MTTTLATVTTLTRLRLSPYHLSTASDVADIHVMHQRVMRMFPQATTPHPRAEHNVLFRIVRMPTNTIVLVQATTRPTPDLLPTGYAAADTIDLTPLLDRLDHGTRVRYRIVANATAIHTTEPGKKRRLWLHDEEAIQWWQRRANQAGLAVQHTRLTQETLLTGARPKSAGGQRLHHGASQFDGIAVINDPDAIRRAVTTGIGRARSYGCGLLTLALCAPR
ncbi:type I-E CRISPR-associated protein Cas6/Cse3/CasE [Saccharothrix sp. Mg75]|uniref:type I-E CRISPR-associated protein Cas6/Cse3/CasE n=1 Tax=Saccharothrix sp. Mg75 TaxID=3445357 RepID=UPI003EE8AF69